MESKRPSKRKRLSDKTLAVFTEEHLTYEVQMLFATASAIATVKLTEENACVWATRMALIESFTMHARVLVDFLYGKKRKSDDAIAEDFFDDPSVWREKRGDIPNALRPIRWRVGKEVAHLTYTRSEVMPEDKLWEVSRIAGGIGSVLKRFVDLVPAHRLGRSFRKAISQVQISQDSESAQFILSFL